MPASIADINESLARYAAGPDQLRAAIGKLSLEQVRTRIAPGRWSILEVVCHLADFELVYADRLKRVIAEDRPTLFGGDPDRFAERLAYDRRDLEEELQVIEAVRRQVARCLQAQDASAFDRVGIHSDDGPLTLSELLRRITSHIPHHADFIRRKRQALGAA